MTCTCGAFCGTELFCLPCSYKSLKENREMIAHKLQAAEARVAELEALMADCYDSDFEWGAATTALLREAFANHRARQAEEAR